jgi:hypothetical protein
VRAGVFIELATVDSKPVDKEFTEFVNAGRRDWSCSRSFEVPSSCMWPVYGSRIMATQDDDGMTTASVS